MNLFIDTNVLLSFYHLTSDDLEELRKLAVLLEQEKVALLLTDQVREEFLRNREGKIADSIKRLKDQKLNLQFPQICKDYPEYLLLRDIQKKYDEQHSALLGKLQSDIESKKLKADSTIESLFAAATALQREPALVSRARLRVDLGNPPGKNGSLGDAVNWELLLEKVPVGEDLYFVTEDRDFFSVLEETNFNEFLLHEWHSKKKSSLHYYKRLSSFFKDKFPDIKLATELEKELLIKQLVGSLSFATTHAAIAKLQKHSDFTDDQAAAIASAALFNSQILWILDDADVHAFMEGLLSSHKNVLDADVAKALEQALAPPTVKADDNEAPF